MSGTLSGNTAASHLLRRLDALEGGCRRYTRTIATVGVIGMLAVSFATVIDIGLRFVANSGITALNEIVSLIFVVAVAACIPSGLAHGVSITVDILEDRFSARQRAFFRALGATLLLAFFALLSWRILVTADQLAGRGRTTVILQWRVAPFLYCAAGLLILAAAVQFIVALRGAVHAWSGGFGTSDKASAILGPIALIVTGALAAIVSIGFYDLSILSEWARANTLAAVVAALMIMWACLLGMIPLAVVMGLIGIGGLVLFMGVNPALGIAATEAIGFMSAYHVTTLPLFLLMGSLAVVAGIADDVYRLAQALFGSFRGGLGMATIGGCAGFGAVTGSSLATVVTIGRASMPAMRARGYAPELSIGCVAAGGTLGALIPPSSPLIVFALLTESSIGKLFLAAVIPGILATILYILTVMITVRLRPSWVPPVAARASLGEVATALRQCFAAFLLFALVIGGIYSGLFTVTEAAAVGAATAFLIAFSRGRLGKGAFWAVMAETTASTAMIYTLIFGVLIFSFFITVTQMPEMLTSYVSALALPPIVIIVLILLVFVVLGCFMDSFTVMIVTIPIVTTIVLKLGYDIIWWGVINLIIIELGLITPPFGLHLFILKNMASDVSLKQIYVGVVPFCLTDLFKLTLIVAFPIIALWLPSTMFD